MTQVLGLMTPHSVMMAADRLLTWVGGPHDGKVYRDEECKLVALCGFGAIGYTGLARIASQPTHEWIATTLAKANSRRVADAALVLPTELEKAVGPVPTQLRGLTLFAAGWDFFGTPPALRPHFALFTNQYDLASHPLPCPSKDFRVLKHVLQPSEPFGWHSVGAPVPKKRAVALSRALRRALSHNVGAHRLLKYLVEEVQHTSTLHSRVGDRVLAMHTPRRSVESWLKTGHRMLVADRANAETATFGYFNPDRRELLQLGPTSVCGESAFTDLTTTDDPANETQSSSFRILYLPKPKTPAGAP